MRNLFLNDTDAISTVFEEAEDAETPKQKAQPAPFADALRARPAEPAEVAMPLDIDAVLQHLIENQGKVFTNECFATVLYIRSGLLLIAIKVEFKRHKRRDFCRVITEAGIKPWFRKRAMQLAGRFRNEEAGEGIPLLKALAMAGKDKSDDEEKPASKSQKKKAKPRHEKGLDGALHDEGDPGEGNEDEDEDQNDAFKQKLDIFWKLMQDVADEDFAITDVESRSFTAFQAAIGDDNRAIHVALYHVWNMIQID